MSIDDVKRKCTFSLTLSCMCGDYSFVYEIAYCDPYQSVKASIDLAMVDNIDVFIGPACSQGIRSREFKSLLCNLLTVTQKSRCMSGLRSHYKLDCISFINLSYCDAGT